MKRSMIVTCLITGAGTLTLFQNCANPSFTDASIASVGTTADGNPADPIVQTTSVATPTPGPTATPVAATPTPTPVPPGVGSLSVTFNPQVVASGSSAAMNIEVQNLDTVAYECLDKSGGSVVKGSLNVSDSASKSITVDRDLDCTFVGTNAGDSRVQPVDTSASVSVNCGNKIKTTGGTCEDFTCKSVVQIQAADLMKVPARTADGICYAYKLMSKIANSSSDLTKTTDSSVMARNHGRANDSSKNAHPFLMGQFKGDFNLLGARVVKLAGGVDEQSPILVDNFILTGVYPKAAVQPVNVLQYYNVTGSSDSSLLDSTGKALDYIQFNNENIKVKVFATGGTSSIAPIDITAAASPNVVQTLDIRALDCGGSRALSDIYLLFQ